MEGHTVTQRTTERVTSLWTVLKAMNTISRSVPVSEEVTFELR